MPVEYYQLPFNAINMVLDSKQTQLEYELYLVICNELNKYTTEHRNDVMISDLLQTGPSALTSPVNLYSEIFRSSSEYQYPRVSKVYVLMLTHPQTWVLF